MSLGAAILDRRVRPLQAPSAVSQESHWLSAGIGRQTRPIRSACTLLKPFRRVRGRYSCLPRAGSSRCLVFCWGGQVRDGDLVPGGADHLVGVGAVAAQEVGVVHFGLGAEAEVSG